MRLQHEHRRDGIILVNGMKYDLDANGVVEVPPEAAAKMQQGGAWRSEGGWGEVKPPVAMPEPQNGARRARTREELEQAAVEAGVKVAPAKVAKPADPTPEPVPASEETITVDESMSKSELLEAAQKAGLAVDPKMTKAQILDLFEQQP